MLRGIFQHKGPNRGRTYDVQYIAENKYWGSRKQFEDINQRLPKKNPRLLFFLSPIDEDHESYVVQFGSSAADKTSLCIVNSTESHSLRKAVSRSTSWSYGIRTATNDSALLFLFAHIDALGITCAFFQDRFRRRSFDLSIPIPDLSRHFVSKKIVPGTSTFFIDGQSRSDRVQTFTDLSTSSIGLFYSTVVQYQIEMQQNVNAFDLDTCARHEITCIGPPPWKVGLR